MLIHYERWKSSNRNGFLIVTTVDAKWSSCWSRKINQKRIHNWIQSSVAFPFYVVAEFEKILAININSLCISIPFEFYIDMSYCMCYCVITYYFYYLQPFYYLLLVISNKRSKVIRAISN
jgi:hypothetical protein